MKTFLTIFNAFPAILQSVVAVEGALPVSQSGQQKMGLILGAAGAAWEIGQVGQQISKNNWLSAVQTITNITVAGLNAAGAFGSSQAAATPVVSK